MLKHIISLYRLKFQMWMRQRTRPLSVEEAEAKRFFWAKIYALTSLLILVLCTHNVYLNQRPNEKTDDMPEVLKSFSSSNKPVRVLKYKGFSKVSDVTYSPEELNSLLKKPSNESSVIKDPEDSVTENSFEQVK